MISTIRSRAVKNYKVTSPSLRSVVFDIDNGHLKLPSFQRSWCWGDNDVRKLIASIAAGDPIGSFTFTHAGPIGNRSLASAEKTAEQSEAVQLILDGQQRLTAAYQALCRPTPVRIEATLPPEYRLYFFDMETAVAHPDSVETAIISITTRPDGVPVSDSNAQYAESFYQYERGLFPTNLIFDPRAYQRGFSEFWQAEVQSSSRRQAFRVLDDFRDLVVERFATYLLPVLTLDSQITADETLRIFKKLNARAHPHPRRCEPASRATGAGCRAECARS